MKVNLMPTTKQILFFFIFFTLPLIANSSIKIVQPSDGLPLELRLILNHLELTTESEIYPQIVNQLKVIDQTLNELEEQDILFFVKSQIYKDLMTNHPAGFTDARSIDIQLLRQFREQVDSSKVSSPIYTWLVQAISTDLDQLFRNNIFRRALSEQEQGRELSPEEQREMNKANLILPWIRLFSLAEKEIIKHELDQFSLRSIERLSLSLYQFIKFSRIDEFAIDISSDEMANFRIIKKEQEAYLAEKNRIQTIVERIINRQQELPTPTDEWQPREEASASQIIRPSEDYTPPASLPKPVNDWLEDL